MLAAHPVARLAYALAQWINPNNHALDGGRASSRMEKEAVAALAAMVGGKPTSATHLRRHDGEPEALWVARNVNLGTTVVASTSTTPLAHRRGARYG